MKFSSAYSVFYFEPKNIDNYVTDLVKKFNLTVKHHFENDSINYYVVADANGNCTDFFSPKAADFKAEEGFWGIRLNTDDFDGAEKLIKSEKAKQILDIMDTPSCTFAAYENKDKKYNTVLFTHMI